jgi:hypothetical protein
MMNIRFSIATLVFSLLTGGSLGQDKPSAKPTYADLVAKVKAGDKSVDFKELRLAYADWHGGKDTDAKKKAMRAALNSENCAEVLKNADAVLAEDYADMDAHFAEHVAHRELKNADQAELHKFVLKGLLDSITHSGDGKTPQTAFQVIEVHEEYVLLRFMGLMPAKQSLLKKDGHSYDEMEAVNPKTQEKVTLYFNIDIEEKHLKETLRH